MPPSEEELSPDKLNELYNYASVINHDLYKCEQCNGSGVIHTGGAGDDMECFVCNGTGLNAQGELDISDGFDSHGKHSCSIEDVLKGDEL
jgi:hypothetical protein